MPLQLIPHDAPAASAAGPSGSLRGLATAVGHARALAPTLATPTGEAPAVGRVTSRGRWDDEAVRRALRDVLGAALAPALRAGFEWYLCRGAFFHTDAHYDGVLFGVWSVAGPAADIVFPRAGLRVDGSPGHVAIFDPFEVHGVLARGRERYAAEDYAAAAANVFIGFELALTDAVADAFRLAPAGSGRTLSSRTRVAAATGAFE
jgi:hypothetical protein